MSNPRFASAPDATAPELCGCLFGPFEARVGGDPLPRLRTRKGQWLLAQLVLRAGRAALAEQLRGRGICQAPKQP